MKDAEQFIAGKLRFRAGITAVAITVSFFVITLSVAVSSGFRQEIRSALGDMAGDVILSGEEPVDASPSYLPSLKAVRGVDLVSPVIYRSGILKFSDGDIRPAVFKGEGNADSSLCITIPEKLSREKGLSEGDRLTAYFISERVKARNLKVIRIEPRPVEADGKLLVTMPIADLRRINGWGDEEASALEVRLHNGWDKRSSLRKKASEIGAIALLEAEEDERILTTQAVTERYPQIFDWLDLIEVNVLAILVIMIIVAGFNMISGLLILLFRSIPTIGTLKAVGMTDRGIAGVFLRISSRLVLTGMAVGNILTLLFCLVQGNTHLIRLNPENYFVSFVPVRVNALQFIAYDAAAYVGIMILLLIPCLFISRIDPAESVKIR